MSKSPSSKPFDVIVFGATSFVGQLLCRYLWQRYGADGGLKWAIAGRSQAKLDELLGQLGTTAERLPVRLARADHAEDLAALCSEARVVVSTVGPYALYGSELVRICAETGTDYCDLTGETPWIGRMIAAHEAKAKASGARIVHCCGFDSIPSDLGVFVLQREAMEQFAAPCSRVKMRVKAARGGFSGGTVASLLNAVKEATADPAIRKAMGNPFALCPPGTRGPRQPDVRIPEIDPDFDAWLAPFVMAAINTRVVHRSHALLGQAWGQNFIYDEAMLTGKGLAGRAAAFAVAGGLGGFMLASVIKPSRALLEKTVLPKPGQGPSPEAQEKGFFDIRLHGRTDAGQTLMVKVTGDRDPGYGSTSKMLGEAAACLAMDIPKTTVGGGFWTPSTAMGAPLVERLKRHAGLSFSVIAPR